ncbi:hypothetical protein [Agromyces atrinae]|uniref:EcsC family protein n=1 Tax=Agromyces atrinae TaxID=592376 RepID=A0A852S9Y6_9MICO|nr:hypothetical protein [Agromyces atrinae]NYD65624.1 hypothetical protein [Agromyces atrinae]
MAEPVHSITSMTTDSYTAYPGPGTVNDESRENAGARVDGADPALLRGIDRVLAVQRPVVLAHLRSIRRRHPSATPAELTRILERRYLTAVTTGGAAVGATAVIPGIGTGVTLALSGVETAGFLEATALFAQSVSEVHGIAIENPERARALVMTLILGREGSDLVRQFAGQAVGNGAARNAYWGELITNTLPKALMSTVTDRLKSVFLKQFAVRGGASIVGKAIPFGIGAAIGGTGNHILGRRVLTQARLAFGTPPAVLPTELEPTGLSSVDAASQGITRLGVAFGGAIVRAAGSTGHAISGAAGSTARAARKALPKGKRDRTTDDAGSDVAEE